MLPGRVSGPFSPRGVHTHSPALPGPPSSLPIPRRSTSLTPLRIATGIFGLALSLGFLYLLTLTLRLQARLEANDAMDTSISRSLTSQGSGGGRGAGSEPPSPPLHRTSEGGLQPSSLPSLPCPECPACTGSRGTAAVAAGAAGAAGSTPGGGASTQAAAGPTDTTTTTTTTTSPRPGLRRLLSDLELDDLFRVRSELDAAAFGTTGDTSLLPLLVRVYGEHKWVRGFGGDGAGGFMDVGANIGDVSEDILRTFGGQGRVQHHHYLAPDLSDPEHPSPGSNDKVPFLLALEGSPGTLELLNRRAGAGAWSACNARILGLAAGNTSTPGATATFCSHKAGSEKSGLAGEGASGATTDGERVCTQVPSDTITGVLNKEVGEKARIFLLKIDVEGAEAVVLSGGAPLFAAKRVSYVVFENHAKWHGVQESLGVSPFVSVGDVVREMGGWGYKCWYMSPWGLFPFPTPGSAEGEVPMRGCTPTIYAPSCARWRLYSRQFWSNILCAASPEEDEWMAWIEEVTLEPRTSREKLLAKAK